MNCYKISRGTCADARLTLLIQLTKIRSVRIINALRLHFVAGYTLELAALRAGVDAAAVSRRAKRIQMTHEIVEAIKELDIRHD